MTSIYVRLRREERAALWRYADQERRDPRDQAAMLIREALIAAGALTNDGQVPHDPRWDLPPVQEPADA